MHQNGAYWCYEDEQGFGQAKRYIATSTRN